MSHQWMQSAVIRGASLLVPREHRLVSHRYFNSLSALLLYCEARAKFSLPLGNQDSVLPYVSQTH